MTALDDRCRDLITELGLGTADEVTDVTPLTGGVASDIARVRVGDRTLCVKFALPKLKVAAEWRAPVHRNAADYAWLETAHRVSPDNAVELLGHSAAQHGFAMAYLEGSGVFLWKDALLREASDTGDAARVGDFLGRIHAASTQPGFDDAPFHNRDDFRALRIEPYLSYTADQHPTVSPQLHALADALYAADEVLVHGDVSPKNIFFRDGAPVLLDAECATLGDASFDPAFCLNHLVLKAVHLPTSRRRYLADAGALWDAYRARISWTDPADLESRVCRLVPALMLARVDGKSPVEYLGDADRDRVRALSLALIAQPTTTLNTLLSHLTRTLESA